MVPGKLMIQRALPLGLVLEGNVVTRSRLVKLAVWRKGVGARVNLTTSEVPLVVSPDSTVVAVALVSSSVPGRPSSSSLVW